MIPFRLILPVLLLTPVLSAANIPETHDTVCRRILAQRRLGKTKPCRVTKTGSAPRPNLPDMISLDYRIGSRHYLIEGEYRTASESWHYRHKGRAVQTYPAKRQDGRYTCHQGAGTNFCALDKPF